jgi:hypothetical protein
MNARGDRLYALVAEYEAMGDHRTGTPVDRETREWFEAQLSGRGARVESIRYDFDRYLADAEVFVGDDEVRCVPLFYSGVGTVETDAPYVSRLDGPGAGDEAGASADARLSEARTDRRPAAVLATGGSSGHLVAVNRAPVEPPGPIAVLVAGSDLPVGQGDVRVTAAARVVRGESATVVARFERRGGRARPLLVATPLTGWFACAGERGTGIALALELAAELAGDVPVEVVATTGHEIGYLGLRDHLARDSVDASVILHLGASLAAGDGETLGPLRGGLADGLAPDRVVALAAELEPGGLPIASWDPSVPADAGEGSVWRGRGAPVVSLVGWFDRFHTPEDFAASVTSPALLETVFESLVGAARLLVAD